MNYSSGINYLYDFLGLDRSNFKIFYDFSSGSYSSSVVNSVPFAESGYSGITQSLNVINSSGAFAGNAANLIKITNITEDSFGGEISFLLKFRTVDLTASKRVLFSSLTGEGYKSGFNIGVNQANYPYFEYYDSSGPVILTSKNRLSETNILSVNIGDNNISIGKYDINRKFFIEDSFVINSNYLLFSDQWHLGGSVLPGQSGQYFSGYLAGFLCFNTLTPNNINSRLASGFFSIVNDPSSNLTGLQFTDFSGFSGQSSLIKTSGFDSSFSTFTDNLYPLYNITQQELTLSSGEDQIPVYETLSGDFQISSSDFSLSIVKNELLELGYDSVTYAWRELGIPFVEAYINTGVNENVFLNKFAAQDAVAGVFSADSAYESGSLNGFLNGVMQIESGFDVTGQFYNSGKSGITDFFLEESNFIFKESVSDSDVLLYDSDQNQNRIIFQYSGQSSIDFGSNSLIYNTLFFNGQKIVSGVDYSFSGDFLLFSSEFNSIFNQISGKLLAVSGLGANFNRITGVGSFYNVNKFLPNSNVYYLNGVRHPPEHFVEHSFLSPLQGNFIFDENLSEINNGLIDDWT